MVKVRISYTASDLCSWHKAESCHHPHESQMKKTNIHFGMLILVKLLIILKRSHNVH